MPLISHHAVTARNDYAAHAMGLEPLFLCPILRICTSDRYARGRGAVRERDPGAWTRALDTVGHGSGGKSGSHRGNFVKYDGNVTNS